MLQIGFSTKYFTLWDVQNQTEYSGSEGQYSYNVTRFTYLQNLSLVEEKAIAKAKEKGCTQLGINDELRGRSGRSFEKRTRIEKEFELHQFTYGKYEGDDIRENTDVNYLKWYFNETELMLVAERVCKLDSDYSIYENGLVTSEQLDNITKTNTIEAGLKKTGTIQLQMERNLDTYGFVQIDGIPYSFENYCTRSYNGYGYGLPTLNGKAKRVKNKLIEVKVEFGVVGDWEMWKVTEWDFVK
jgi:hypothetical protein